jgi:mono/diheme cytochrome c family protein
MMTRKKRLIALSRCVTATALVTFLAAQEQPPVLVNANLPKAEAVMDPTVLRDKAMQVMETYCFSCHGEKKQKNDIRFDTLDAIDPVDLQDLFADAQKSLQIGEMPPEEAKRQPGKEERELLVKWLETQVTGDAAKALAEKLKRFEYGNVVDHEDLFSGKNADLPGSTPDRRWLVSEFIFSEKVNSLLDYTPTRTIYGKQVAVRGDSGIHWSPKTEGGNKFRRTITNPFLLPKKVGVRYSANEALTGGHLLTMIGNAKRIAGYMSSESTVKSKYPAIHVLMETEYQHRATLESRERFLTTYSYMEQLLKNIYAEKNEALLPSVKPVNVPFPQPNMRNGQPVIEKNLGHFASMDQIDLTAILRGMHAYNGEGVSYDRIIEQSERDWVMEGVIDSRIQNRVGRMKSFFVNWDMPTIFKHAADKRYARPAYAPLKEAEMQVIIATIKKHRKQGDGYQAIIEKCMADWETSLKAERDAMPAPSNDLLGALVTQLYGKIFEREPTQEELEKNIAVLMTFMDKLDRQTAIGKLIESLILNTEFAYRNEFGQGDADEHGRRMLSPIDASHALAYALTDSGPDPELAKAAAEGRLNTREDYAREVRRMLARRDVWTIIDEGIQAAGLNASVTNQPIRKLRFFREFFGYPKAMEVFKDDVRFGAGLHEPTVSRLIDEADLLVEHILQQDRNVFETLLTTEEFYVYHNGDNAAMQAASDHYKDTYNYFKKFDWKKFTVADLPAHEAFMKSKSYKGTMSYLPGGDKNALFSITRFMTIAEKQFGAGQQNAVPFMFANSGFWNGGPVLGRTGQQMRGEQVTSYWNIDWRTWDYPTQQPVKIPNRKGLLTHPAWLIAQAQNLETDPIHRGKWVREKLLAGTIPDVPINVDAVIPLDHTRTMRQRMEDRTGAEACWRCHQKMDPLGFPFELYDDFGRYRMQEFLEHPENLIKKAPAYNAPIEELTFGAMLPVYKSLPVNPRGALDSTGDPKLDGEVKDSFDMIDRLAKSPKTRQSIIRHAFRFFMGRNENLSDSKTLIDAEKAYLNSKGSFDEVIVSLLTSDSYIFRKSNTKP